VTGDHGVVAMKRMSGRGWAVLMAVGVMAGASGCGDHDHESVDDPCGEPSYGGEATDEAWMSMVDGYELATTGHQDAAVVTIPSAGEILTGETPPTFAWTSPLAMLDCPGRCGPLGGFRLPLVASGPVAALSKAARAHLPPISGDIHLVEVVVAGRECPIRTLTTTETWRPRLTEWEEMRGKGVLELIVTSAYLEENRITEGPFRTTTTFEVR